MGMRRTAESHQAHADFLQRLALSSIMCGYIHVYVFSLRELSGLTASLSGLADTAERNTSNTTTSMDTMLTQVFTLPSN